MALIHLFLSIMFSTVINLIFRGFKDYNVNKFQAIMVNYFVCFVIGFSLSTNRELAAHFTSDWFPYCILLGFFFVTIFFSMALTTEKMGISVTAVSGKMSVVVPILFAYAYWNESISTWFVIGLILSLLSIYFISIKKDLNLNKKHLLLPLIVFIGGGIIDTSLKILESTYSQNVSMDTISYSIFLGAFIAGMLLFIIRKKGDFSSFTKKSLVSGIILGVPNYFSIYFLLTAIAGFSGKSAFVFGINNIGVVLLSTLLSVILYGEKLSKGNKLGIVLAILSISIIAYAN